MKARLVDLPDMHPCLLRDDILAATVAVMDDRGLAAHHSLVLDVVNAPDYGTDRLPLEISPTGVPASRVAKVRRTYEAHRQIELAAIAVSGLAVFHAGGHQIRDVALRGSAADYLVDEESHLLEITGRSRRSDFSAAWDTRWRRLSDRLGSGFYVCAVEFETPAGRLEFAP